MEDCVEEGMGLERPEDRFREGTFDRDSAPLPEEGLSPTWLKVELIALISCERVS